jgi:hypothetical protein
MRFLLAELILYEPLCPKSDWFGHFQKLPHMPPSSCHAFDILGNQVNS